MDERPYELGSSVAAVMQVSNTQEGIFFQDTRASPKDARPSQGAAKALFLAHSAEPLRARHNHSLRKNNESEANSRACLHSLFFDTQGVRYSCELGWKSWYKMSKTLLANPAKMIAKGAPRVTHNDEELEAYTDALFQLTALENPSRSEREAIELLTLLIERYEETHYPIPPADAASVVRLLLEQQGLTQRDLIPEFGSEGGVSMFLTRRRKPTLQQVRKLSARFKPPADAFIQSR
jgi:HTH-type transcriptional regulator / antitoxin HigA